MSSRTQQKAHARRAREQAEARDAAQAMRRRRLGILGGLAGLALVVVVVAVVVSGGSSSKTPSKAKAASVTALFAGVPQKGFVLGSPKAPVTVEEFLDPQCPFCAQFSREALPTVIRDQVRTGRIRLVMRPQAFIGQDSVVAARAVAAAARQDHAWTLLDLIYANQGPE